LSGAPGTGKSVACLQFLAAALNAGERAAILTQDDPEDVLSQSEFLSLDLMNAVASEQLILLRFQLDFSRRFSRAPSPDAAFTELRKLLGADAPTRLVIDSVVPFIDGGSSASSSAVGMLQLLDDLGSTSLVTYPGDLAGVYDRRLDPLVQRAAAIFHFSADRQRHRHIEIRKVRYRVPSVSPIPYRIEPGVGVVPALEDVRWQQEDHASSPDRQRLVLDLPAGSAQDALRLLQGQYNVKVMNGTAPTRPTPIKHLSAVPARRAADFPDSNEPTPKLPAQPTKNGVHVPLDAAGFRAEITEVTSNDPRAVFVLAVVTPPPGKLAALSNVSLQTVRAVNGDLVGLTNNQVLIHLHATGRKHAPYFIDRLRENWKNAGSGELIIDVLAYPADQDRLRNLLNSIV
jgi:KaiC/GvpD/RAD55 family RecA-like ATPase